MNADPRATDATRTDAVESDTDENGGRSTGEPCLPCVAMTALLVGTLLAVGLWLLLGL